MVQLKENEIVITIKAEEPAQKLAELQESLIYILRDYFSHLGNEVDVEGGAAYDGMIALTIPSFPRRP